MILGTVNDAYEAVISLTVRGPSGQSREVDAVIDTRLHGLSVVDIGTGYGIGIALPD